MEEIKSPNKIKTQVHVYGYIELTVNENETLNEIKKRILSALSENDLKFSIEIPPHGKTLIQDSIMNCLISK